MIGGSNSIGMATGSTTAILFLAGPSCSSNSVLLFAAVMAMFCSIVFIATKVIFQFICNQ
jgi:hypothetical protein